MASVDIGYAWCVCHNCCNVQMLREMSESVSDLGNHRSVDDTMSEFPGDDFKEDSLEKVSYLEGQSTR